MTEPVLSYELKSLLNKIKSELTVEYPIQVITLNYLMYSILSSQTNDVAYWLSNNILTSEINILKNLVLEKIKNDTSHSIVLDPNAIRFAKEYDQLAEEISNNGEYIVTSNAMFIKIIEQDNDYIKFLANNGFTLDEVKNKILKEDKLNQNNNSSIDKTKTTKSKKKNKNNENKINSSLRIIPEENNLIEASGINLIREASKGKYKHIIGYENIINNIFNVISKHNKKNVVLVGDSGVGKSSVLYRLAQIMYEQNCPYKFKEQYLIQLESLLTQLGLKEFKKNAGKYIVVIDDLEVLLMSKEFEAFPTFFIDMITSDITVICTMNTNAYTKILQGKPELGRHFQKINIEEPNEEFLNNIINHNIKYYETNTTTKFTPEAINTAKQLSKRFITTEKTPLSTLNLLDYTSSMVRINTPDSEELISLKKQISEIIHEREQIPSTADMSSFERKDQLIREELRLKSEIDSLATDKLACVNITSNDIKTAVSKLIGLPVTELNENDKNKLKQLQPNLLKYVIGQDDTVEKVAKVVKRQRVGLSNPNKPCVMLFVGSTGSGKSFLAKRLAHEMFGDEKKIVRIDMSEYAEKTSVSKLYGTAPGYIGYEEGGVLTEAIKKNKHCVLLLDEIEKAHEDVYNVFLQVFDEGRLTDSRGTVVDFKNVIIIMTSNVGARNVSEKTARIGFTKTTSEEEENKEIILKSIKKEFKPEFINRIDNICYFNKLTEDNLKSIIDNEIKNVHQRVKNIGYDFDNDIFDGTIRDNIFNEIKEEIEYGARPILREIQKQLEDKITDYIIDNDIELGYIFKLADIYNKTE